MKLGIHDIETFKSCKQKAYFSVVENIASKEIAPALHLGSEFHKSIASVLYSPDKLSAEAERLEVLGATVFHKPFLGEILRLTISKLSLMKIVFDSQGAPLIEYYFEVPIKDHIYSGTIDLVVEDVIHGIMVVDHKTTSFNSMTHIMSLLESDQLRGYVWASSKLSFPTLAAGINILHIPRTNGRTFDAPQLYPVIIADWEIENFVADTLATIEEFYWMVEQKDQVRWTKNRSQCFSYNRLCEFSPLCFANPKMLDSIKLEKFTAREQRWSPKEGNAV